MVIDYKEEKSKHEDLKFELAGVTLPRVKDVLDLGVNFTSKLNFSNHIAITIAKVKRRLFFLKTSFKSRIAGILILILNICSTHFRLLLAGLESPG